MGFPLVFPYPLSLSLRLAPIAEAIAEWFGRHLARVMGN